MVIEVHSQGFLLLIMPISNMQWRVEIGINIRQGLSMKSHYGKYVFLLLFVLVFVVFVVLILFACGDTELNPGPKKRSSCCNFPVCHWSLNSITAQHFAKIDLLQAFNTIHQYDIIFLSESYLDATASSDNDI